MGFDVWLENRTPFDAATHVQLDNAGQEVLLVLLSASFEDRDGGLAVAETQMPVCFADVARGDPATSSVVHEADVAPVKPMIEVIVLGSAHAPGGTPARVVEVGLVAGPIRKVLRVVGDRSHSLGGTTEPHPFRTMPLIWERAFGGTAQDGTCDPRNPVGVGWKGARPIDPAIRTEAPNLLYPGDEGDTPAPAGFGPVGRGWQPRLALAGTYDQAWLDTQWPLPPADFDPRHNLCAPADQRAPEIPTGSRIAVMNMTPSGRWDLRLPTLRVPLRLIYADRIDRHDLRFDTIIIEPDAQRITLKARHAVRLRRNVPRLLEAVLGHVSPVWLNARRKRKRYVDLLGGDGTLTAEPVWEA